MMSGGQPLSFGAGVVLRVKESEVFVNFDTKVILKYLATQARTSLPVGPDWVRNLAGIYSAEAVRLIFISQFIWFDDGRTRARTLDPLI
jgi:hypothetical protein